MADGTLAGGSDAVKEPQGTGTLGRSSDERTPAAPAVVLVRPREDGNVGSVARAMANMGLARLILVAPLAPLGTMARAMAHGATDLLDAAERADTLEQAIGPFRLVVGTTSTRDREDRRAVLAAPELAAELAVAGVTAAEVALVFGPEVSGLSNEELVRCNLLVNIPCAPVHPTLNLAQSVLLLAWELRRATLLAGPSERPEVVPASQAPAPAAAIAGLFTRAETLLRHGGFARSTTFAAVLRDLRALCGRARLSEREVAILGGVVRRLGRAVGLAAEPAAHEPALTGHSARARVRQRAHPLGPREPDGDPSGDPKTG